MMTPDEAGASLRDDPTFATMRRHEQEAEAAALLGTDDPLDVALAIEAALSTPHTAATTSGPAGESCRLQRSGCTSPLAGNGRCLECGAYRTAPPAADTPWNAVEQGQGAQSEPPASQTPAAPENAPAGRKSALPRPRGSAAASGTLTGRIKSATGAYDKDLAALVKLSRPTVQAYAAGRLAESYTPDQRAALAAMLTDRRDTLDGLISELLA